MRPVIARPVIAPPIIAPGRQITARHSYAYLDGVRGWAALMVAYSHFVIAMHPAMIGADPARAHFPAEPWLARTGLTVLYNPQLAVDVFFVLSGFVLATSVTTRPAPFVELAVRRWVRLGLPILATTALIWPLVHWRLFAPDAAGALAKSDWLRICYNWPSGFPWPDLTLVRLFRELLVLVFVNGASWYNPVLWTMKMEFCGSIALYAGYCLLPRDFAARGGGLLAALIAIAFVWNVPLLGSFAFGIALFEIVRLLRRQPEPRRAAMSNAALPAGILLLLAGILLGGIPNAIDVGSGGFYARLYLAVSPWIPAMLELAYRLAALCLVAAAVLCRPLQRLLLTRVSQWLGRISFMLYLVHVPILCSLGAWLLLRLEPPLGYNPATAAILPIYLAGALAIAHLTTRLIDAPSIRLSRHAGAAVLPALLRLRHLLHPVAAAR